MAGCVTIAGGGGDSVATMLDAFRETQDASICPGGGNGGAILGLLAIA